MTAGIYDFIIEQGADFNLPLIWTDSAGTPINITGWTAELMIRQNYADPISLLSLSSPSNGITLGGSAGTIAVYIPALSTTALTQGAYLYDLKITDSSGHAQRLIQGTVTVSPEVST